MKMPRRTFAHDALRPHVLHVQPENGVPVPWASLILAAHLFMGVTLSGCACPVKPSRDIPPEMAKRCSPFVGLSR
jgi:hypothetical protein